MKNIQKCLLVSLVPLLIPLTAFAEPDEQSELITPISGTKVRTDSWRASQVMGTDVKNAEDETIGDVEDLLLDMRDMQITKDIRSEIMGTDLSSNAKNIKVITRDAKVTLKGMVGSDDEHQAVLNIAANHANTTRILDRLKVDSK